MERRPLCWRPPREDPPREVPLRCRAKSRSFGGSQPTSVEQGAVCIGEAATVGLVGGSATEPYVFIGFGCIVEGGGAGWIGGRCGERGEAFTGGRRRFARQSVVVGEAGSDGVVAGMYGALPIAIGFRLHRLRKPLGPCPGGSPCRSRR